MSTSNLHIVGFACAAAALATLAGACAREMYDSEFVSPCGFPTDTYVSSRSGDDGREVVVSRVLPAAGNCEGDLVTRLRYDDRGVLIRREDEHRRCGVLEQSVVAVRDDRGWSVERSRNVDHDEIMDEQHRSTEPAGAVEPSEQREPLIACAIAQAERQDGSWSAVK
jgi:hypothetical protein